MKELREFEQRNQEKRNLQLRQLEAIMNTGLPVNVKLTTKVYLLGDQFESMPSDRQTEEATLDTAFARAEVKMKTQPDIPVDTVTTEYHDDLMNKWNKRTVELKEQILKTKKLYEREADSAARLREDNMGWKEDWNTLRGKNKKLVKKCEELMQLLDVATAPKEAKIVTADVIPTKKQIKAIDNRSIVKKVESKPGDDPDPYAKVRETRFYGDTGPSKPKGYPAFPSFKGPSLRTKKWVFVKHPPSEHLAKDEIPRLNIRSIRPVFTPLTVSEVWQVRRYIKSGRKNRWIEARMGMTDASVSTLRTGKSFAKVPPEPVAKPPKGAMGPVTVHAGEGIITQDKGGNSLFD